MSRTSKYIGGTRLTTFRLPLDGYKSTRVRVQSLLDEIAAEQEKSNENSVKSTTKQAKTRLTAKQHKYIVYTCGCTLDNGLFRRATGCKIERGKHK